MQRCLHGHVWSPCLHSGNWTHVWCCRSSGWTLYKLIFGAIVCQTAYYTMWAVHNAAVRSLGYGSLTDNLYRICIPLNQLATASFMVRSKTVLGPDTGQSRSSQQGLHHGCHAVWIAAAICPAGYTINGSNNLTLPVHSKQPTMVHVHVARSV